MAAGVTKVPWTGVLLGLTGVAAAVTAALLWRARAEPLGPLLEGADVLVAEGERLLERDRPQDAAARFGEALAARPDHVAALVGRARARARAGAELEVVRADLDRALTLDPRATAALRALAELRLSRGDLRGANDALDRALAAAQAAAEVDRVADVRQRVAQAAATEAALIERSEALLAALDARAAVSSLEAARSIAPESAALHAALVKALTELGRYGDAVRAAEEVERLDPTHAVEAAWLERLRGWALEADRAPGSPPPLDRWWPTLGGVWRDERDTILGAAPGLGEFDLAGLVADQQPGSSQFSVSVDVGLVSGKPAPYAGVFLGARSNADLYVVYVFHDRERPPQEVDEVRRRTGGWPKAVRVARIVDGRWMGKGTFRAEFSDAGFVPLRVDVRGTELTVTVNGQATEAVRLERPLDGRVGLAKYYDTVARFRGFRVEDRR